MISFGRRFFKLSGSGNDFVAFDELEAPGASTEDASWLSVEAIRALCRRGQGVGADGAMVLRPAADADYRLLYYNADGSRGELCGNASLCSVRLAVELGAARGDLIRFHTDAGLVTGRLVDAEPEIDLAPASELQETRSDLGATAEDEHRIGFARVGVPHVVVLCDDADLVDVTTRGTRLRHHPALRDGANVNYVSAHGEGWRIRTFERGVEAETLACGTGSVATAIMLEAWGAEEGGGIPRPGDRASDTGAAHLPAASVAPDGVVRLVTSSGLAHRVRLRRASDGRLQPSLGGAARIVYRGELGEGGW